MLLLMVNEWRGPGNAMMNRGETFPVTNTLLSFSYLNEKRLDLALGFLHAHQRAYNLHYPLAIEFTLLAVSTVQDLSAEIQESMRIERIENLVITQDGFK